MVNQVSGASKREDAFAATSPLAAMRFILCRAASRGHGSCLGLWDVSVVFFHATTEEVVFVRPPKNMRKEKTIWRLLKAMYGTQVASSRWQRLVQETLCDGHWKVLTCVPCVAYNETEDSLVMLHGDVFFLAEGHDSSLDKLDEVLGASEVKCLPRIGPTAGREGVSGKGQANTLSEFSRSEQVMYMSLSGLLQDILHWTEWMWSLPRKR